MRKFSSAFRMSNKRNRNDLNLSERPSAPNSNSSNQNLPHGQNKTATITTTQKVIRQSFVGPLPPPDVLQAYENFKPGLAERIVSLSESEAIHRRELEKQNQEHQNMVVAEFMKERKRGQSFGLTIWHVEPLRQ